MTNPIHEAAEIMPLDEERIPDLAADIKANGLIDPVELLDGMVIDGRRRLRACEVAGVAPRFKNVNTADPVAYVLSKQNRRDLTPSQRAMIGARAVALREKLSAEAKGRQTAGLMKGKLPPVVEPVPQREEEPTRTRDQIGKLVNVSGRTISDATRVLEKGVPELAKAVDEGRIAVKTAAVLATEPVAVQRAELADPQRNRKYKGGPAPADTDGLATARAAQPRTIAVSRADAAINVLREIPRNDHQRARALKMVAEWIELNS